VRIFELGSGLGLLGLIICCSSFPAEFTFSDYHSSVLGILAENVNWNMTLYGKSDVNCSLESSDSLQMVFTGEFSVHFQYGTVVNIAKLDWNSVTQMDLQKLCSCLDIVIAADILYDEDSISPLVNILSNLLLLPNSTCGSVFICCTKRNPQTNCRFLEACKNAGLSIHILLEPVQHAFHYDRSVPIEIIHLKKLES
jgi:predicted nicotinamide N-methyase